MVSSWFLSLMALSCCVCGLQLNVAHTSYQEEEGQNATLDWTFTPRPDPSLKHLFVFCYMVNESKDSVLLRLHEGVQIPLDDEEFSGRVQFDKDLLKEGRIRLHVSSLRTNDSGEYWCWVHLFGDRNSDRCRLNVTADRNQTHSKPGPDRDQTHSKPGPEEPDSWSPGWIALGLTAAVVLVVVLVLTIRRPLKTLSMRLDETDPGESLSELRRNSALSLSSL